MLATDALRSAQGIPIAEERQHRPPWPEPTVHPDEATFSTTLRKQVGVEVLSRQHPELTPRTAREPIPNPVTTVDPSVPTGRSAELADTAIRQQRIRTGQPYIPAGALLSSLPIQESRPSHPSRPQAQSGDAQETVYSAPYRPNQEVMPTPPVIRETLTEVENARRLHELTGSVIESTPNPEPIIDPVPSAESAPVLQPHERIEFKESEQETYLTQHPRLKALVEFVNGLGGGEKYRAVVRATGEHSFDIDVHTVLNGVISGQRLETDAFMAELTADQQHALAAVQEGKITGEMLAEARGEKATSVREKVGRFWGKLHERISAHERDEKALFKQLLAKALAVNPIVAGAAFTESQTMMIANQAERQQVADEKERQLSAARVEFDSVRAKNRVDDEDEGAIEANTNQLRGQIEEQAQILVSLHTPVERQPTGSVA